MNHFGAEPLTAAYFLNITQKLAIKTRKNALVECLS